MDETERRKKHILTPLLVEAGAALMDCQKLEYGVSLLLFHLSRLGVAGLDPQKTEEIMDWERKKTIGQLLQMLRPHVAFAPDAELKLQNALAARNYIIYRVLVANIEQVIDPESRRALIRQIGILRRRVTQGDDVIRPIVESFGAAIDGFNPQTAMSEALRSLLASGEPPENTPGNQA